MEKPKKMSKMSIKIDSDVHRELIKTKRVTGVPISEQLRRMVKKKDENQ